MRYFVVIYNVAEARTVKIVDFPTKEQQLLMEQRFHTKTRGDPAYAVLIYDEPNAETFFARHKMHSDYQRARA